MTYFDYSATTFVDEDVLQVFSDNFDIKPTDELIEAEKEEIKKILNTNHDVLYTSGATESNNWALKQVASKYHDSGYHIITTHLEHSSINETLKYLKTKGFTIDYVNLKDGLVDLDSLEALITDKTILVTIASVNSEVGILQPIHEIGKLLKKYPNIIFHSDMTQSMGKVLIPLDNVDLISFTAHKFFGLKGIGCLLKNKDLVLEPYFYGIRTYNYALIKSMSLALLKATTDISKKYVYVLSLKNQVIQSLLQCPNISINSNNNSIAHILNISITNFKPETFLHTLEMNDIYISTKSACASSNIKSEAVYAVTNNLEKAKTSIRISLSYKTTNKDIQNLIDNIKKCCKDV